MFKISKKLPVRTASTLLIIAGIFLLVRNYYLVPTSQKAAYEKDLQGVFRETFNAMYDFSNEDFGYKAKIITADQYKKAWSTLGTRVTSIRDKELLLLASSKRFKDERLQMHYEGLGYVVEAVNIIEGLFEDKGQEADPIGTAQDKITQGLVLINKAEGNETDKVELMPQDKVKQNTI